MKEHPILFSAPMVRAIMDGRKTHTRRVIKPQPQFVDINFGVPFTGDNWEIPIKCPYGNSGDRLWVRETWQQVNFGHAPEIIYRADNSNWAILGDAFGKWKPSIHMPRRFSRIDLEITNIRVERLQDIKASDVEAEGVDVVGKLPMITSPDVDHERMANYIAVGLFEKLWDSINGEKHPWGSNPWVWVVEFRRI